MTVRILVGDAREVLKTLPDKCINLCTTSPPYYGLRDYGTGRWEGGDPLCEHERVGTDRTPWANRVKGPSNPGKNGSDYANMTKVTGGCCAKCGAEWIDRQIGLEQTIDEYIENMVEVFREVRRVLTDDGILFLNLGDSYASSGGHSSQGVTSARIGRSNVDTQNEVRGFRPGLNVHGIQEKSLLGIPWRIAFALQQDGWLLRQDIVWSKTQPMPESVTDRFTRSHEYIFMLTKQGSYFFDQEAIKEDAVSDHSSGNGFSGRQGGSEHMPMSGGSGTEEEWTPGGKRNKRSVWTVGTETFSWEFCTACKRLYGIAEKKRLKEEVVDGVKRRRCECGRNDKWLSHFATFPPSLIEPCIKAGTSEKGYCGACKKPWERILQKVRVNASNAAKAGTEIEGKPHQVRGDVRENHDVRKGIVVISETVGWQPTCVCRSPDGHPWSPNAGVVLDPFAGAGTTGVVANRLGREAVLIDLNSDYADLAEKRIRGDGGMFVRIVRE